MPGTLRALALGSVLVGCLQPATALFAQGAEQRNEVSLDSLLNTRISAAAKYLQTTSEAAASITIVSAEDIRQQGFSNLQEVLESVPGMYVSNDRNYPYLGSRGFSRPSDYNNRILVLVDGHALNEMVWGSAPIGSDLPLNLDAVERVEVVRGPGSALYGNSAMLAVINIVTRTGTQINGQTISARTGTGLEGQIAVTAGQPFGKRSSFMVAALARGMRGQTLRFPEFATSDNPTGTVRGVDREYGSSVLATLTTGDITTRVGFRSRAKGIPTGSYGTVIGDRRAETLDESLWGEIAHRGTLGSTIRTSARLYVDRGVYHGQLPYEAGQSYSDRSISAYAGGEGMASWDLSSRNRFILGTEVRRVFTADYRTRALDRRLSVDNSQFTLTSVFAQDELQVTPKLKLVGGLRLDQKLTVWEAVTPRAAVILTPARSSTVKFLYGRGYRAPGVAESDLETDLFKPDSLLRAERISTTELAVEQRVGASVLLSVAGYRYVMRDLIEWLSANTVSGYAYRNAMRTHGSGVELALNYQPALLPLSVRSWYTAQQTVDDSSQLQLTNSPQQILNIATVVRGPVGSHGALTLRHETGRRTRDGDLTPAFTRADFNVGLAPAKLFDWRWLAGSDVSLRISNAFNAQYAIPGALEHRQKTIPQDGRMFSLRVRREF
ncbi:MAG: TonB-dependent receptor plug domain-containing protein [Gemmatimonas sp.]